MTIHIPSTAQASVTTKRLASAIALTISLAGPALANNPLTTFAEITDTRPGNITVTPDNRVIITQQPLDGPTLRVVEVLGDGTKIPFPTQDWADGPETGDVGIAATIGIKTDANGVVWILDMGSETTGPKLVAWDTQSDALHKTIDIPADVLTSISFLQDFVLDEARGKIYIADMTFTAPSSDLKPAFVVIDLETGAARRVLEGAEALMPSDKDVVIDGALVGFKDGEGNPQPWHLSMNAISIDPSFEHVYFGTMNGHDILRIPAAALADDSLDDEALLKQIDRYGEKGPNDGFIVDGEGRVFSGDVTRNAVTVSTADSFEVFAQDDTLLSWPDGFAFAPNGTMYIIANQLHTHPALNMGEDGSDNRYFILTVKP
ncbi:major royal jelly protein [Aliiruegeria haliotis]|uniref:Major royal jelly protein n=1 Tax=Aliiruegeria haliotis TaxID=1280846 RepID=A0A2T0RHE7_9RHOB|nr:L-dopachrome tautomerase-related protein [Aliiruegeria haliotis]PRY20530.1 major royal jelly protein [Aliiruegeria haliotis]